MGFGCLYSMKFQVSLSVWQLFMDTQVNKFLTTHMDLESTHENRYLPLLVIIKHKFNCASMCVSYLDEIVRPSYQLCLVGFSSEDIKCFSSFFLCMRLHLRFQKQAISNQDSHDLTYDLYT